MKRLRDEPRGRLEEKRRGKRTEKRGVALIMVMATLSVMTVMLAELTFDASSTLASAMAARDSVQAEYMARSAINLSRLLIAAEPTMRAAIAPLFAFMKRQPPQLPVWEFADRILAPFNDEETAKAAAKAMGTDSASGKNLGMPNGSFELAIIDEDSKINVNLGASNDIAHIRLAQQLMAVMLPPQYSPLFEQRDGQGNSHDRLTICGAIIDWADVDESGFSCNTQAAAPTSAGVEDAFYQLLPKPYRRKNAPFDSLDELHLVRGVGDDFWATFVDPEPEKPSKRVVTVWGQGAVNVNSANPQTLLGIVCSGAPTAEICTNPQQGQTFLMGVTMARGITMGAPLFGSPAEFIQTMKGEGMLGPLLAKQLGMKPVKFLSESEFSKSITTESKVFSMVSVGVVKGYKRDVRVRVHAVVDFRQSPALGGPQGALPPQGAPTTGGTGATAAPSQGAITNALVPSTGGNVVYYRVE